MKRARLLFCLLLPFLLLCSGIGRAQNEFVGDINIPAERDLFVQDVVEFKTTVQKRTDPVSSQECQAYYTMLKKVTFVQAETLDSGVFRTLILKHKYHLIDQERRLREYFFRILGQGLVNHTTDHVLRAKADLMLQALFFAASPAVTSYRANGKHVGSLPIASILTISVASVRVLFTVSNTYSFFRNKKHLNEAKGRLKELQVESARLEKIVNQPPLGMPPEVIAAYILDSQEISHEISILEPAIKQASSTLKRSAKYLGLDAMMTSVYFGSALPYLLGVTGVTAGLTTSVIGTIGYGAILGILIGAKTVADVRQSYQIEAKIDRIKKTPVKPIPEGTDPALIKIKDTASNLRLDNLVAYQKALNKMNLVRDFVTLGLATGIMTVGVMNIIVICGAASLAGAAIATGYGVAGVAGVALVMSVVVYGTEHYWGGRLHDFFKNKIFGRPLKEEDFPASIYHQMMKDHRRFHRQLRGTMKVFEANLDRFCKILTKSPSMEEIRIHAEEFFASNFDVTGIKLAMDKIGVKIAPYQVVLQTMNKEKSKMAKNLYIELDRLDPKLYRPLLEMLEIDPTILDGAIDLAPLELVRYVVSLWILNPA